MSGKTFRNVLRVVHLLGAIPIFMFFYSPLAGDATLETLVRLIIIPTLALSGLMMWQQPRVLKLLQFNAQPARTSKTSDSR